ncbi:MAG: biotin--[acetyl-CoA-carboxylase] ligase [Chloroflexota bacterium]
MKETAVLPHLTTRWLGHSYHFLETTTSTNDVLKKLAADGAAAGTVVATDFQSQGRGRLGRRWEAAPGTSLMLSLLFRPDWPAERALWLTMIAGLAAAEAIESLTPLSISLKWPNDVGLTLADGWSKLGGLLVEGELDENGRLRQVVVGMGLNANMMPEQMPEGITPVTSLLAAGGEPVDRQALLLAFLMRMEEWYETAVSGQSPQPAWQARLVTLGRSVQVTQGDRVLMGTAVGVDEWGHLLLRTPSGEQHTIGAGDVSLRT